jgi:hypothetical protein
MARTRKDAQDPGEFEKLRRACRRDTGAPFISLAISLLPAFGCRRGVDQAI